MRDELEKVDHDTIILFRDILVKYLYDLHTDDPKVVISEVYKKLTDFSDKIKE